MAIDYDKELDNIREDLDDLHDNKVDVAKGKQLSTNDFTDEHLRKVNRIETKEYHQEIVSGVAKDLRQANDNHVRLADEVHRHIRYGSEADNKFKKEVEDNLKNVVNLVRSTTNEMSSIKENWDNLVKEDKDHEGRITQLEGQSERYDSSINSITGAIESIQGEQIIQNTQIKELQDKSAELETRVVDVEVSDAEQNHRLDIAENRIGTFTDRMTALEDGYAQRDARMDGLDAQVSRYTERIHNVELTEKAQNDRIKAEEEKNKRQDIDIACLYAEAKDRTITLDTEGTAVELQNSREGFVVTNSIEGNTMVNCNKDVDKELTLLTSTVDVSSDNNVTLTEGVVDGGKVDVYLEGNTMVNVCDQKDPVAITKSYTVETGNHVALQGEYDGKCRPVVTGNTLVNLMPLKPWGNKSGDGGNCAYNKVALNTLPFKPNTTYTTILLNAEGIVASHWMHSLSAEGMAQGTIATFTTVSDISTATSYLHIYFGSLGDTVTQEQVNNIKVMVLEGDYTNKPIPGYFEGLQSSFEDKVVTQEMVDAGEELAENLGKYKVDYVVTGKNKAGQLLDYNTKGGNINSTKLEKDVTGDVKGYLFRVKPNTSYTFNKDRTDSRFRVFFFKENPINDTSQVSIGGSYADTYSSIRIVTPNNAKYGYLVATNNYTTDPFNWCQIEEGEVATSYEPYKEYKKIFYLNSPLLEGDTIEQQGNNVVHVHRSKEEIFNGDETFTKHPNETDNTLMFTCVRANAYDDKFTEYCYSDKFNSKRVYNEDNEGFYSGSDLVCFRILKSKLQTQDIAGFKQWLQQNPTTAVYKLATPQYEVISTNDTILCDSYTNGHLDVDSIVPIEKVDFLPFKEELVYLYPSTQYAVQFVSNAVSKVDITLGDAKLLNQNVVVGTNKYMITTPSELVHNNLVLNGEGFNASNIVVTEATDQDFGYFEGMKSVGELEGNKIEILSQNKNLLPLSHVSTDSEGYANRQRSNWDNVKLKPNTKYTLSYTGKATNFTNGHMWGIWIREQKTGKLITDNHIIKSETTDISLSFVTTNEEYYKIQLISNNDDNVGSYLFKPNTVILEEGEKTSYIPYALNKKEILLNEPLRAVGDIKDKYVLIDGKWYIERNCGYRNNYSICDAWSNENLTNRRLKLFKLDNSIEEFNDINILRKVKSNKFKCVQYGYTDGRFNVPFLAYITENGNLWVSADINYTQQDMLNYINDCQFVYELPSPTYEPIDYSPFTVYSDITHITNNSTIPCNMTIKNTGFNCLLKPNTTYTVSSNLGLNTVTTPSTLTEDCLRFYDTDTSDVTKMNNVTILEGDYTAGKPIPSHFSGIESAFEQEYDEEKGKYKVKAKVVGKNLINQNEAVINSSYGNSKTICFPVKPNTTYIYTSDNYKGSVSVLELPKKVSNNTSGNIIENLKIKFNDIVNNNSFTTTSNTKYIFMNFDPASNVQLEQGTEATPYEPYKENYIEFYINEPLRGIGDVKDKVYIKDNKVVVERNYGSIVLDGSDDEVITPIYGSIYNNKGLYEIPIQNSMNKGYLLSNTLPCTEGFTEFYNEGIVLRDGSIGIVINSDRLQNIYTASKFKQWLQQNPTTVVYQLAEPTYEEAVYSGIRLSQNIWEKSTLFFDTNIPSTANISYSVSTPILDQVAEVSSITDDQDALIIDMATQLAILNMTM